MSERKIWMRVEKDKENAISGGAVWCHNLCCWLEPYTPPIVYWPPPRYDDPALRGDPNRMILEWSEGNYWRCAASRWTPGRAWLEQPPGPVPPKSPAEIAWENSLTRQNPEKFTSKEIFEAGFYYGKDAAKGTP